MKLLSHRYTVSQPEDLHLKHHCRENIKTQSNIIFPSKLRFFESGSFLQVSRLKFYMHFTYLPCVLHAPSTSFSFI